MNQVLKKRSLTTRIMIVVASFCIPGLGHLFGGRLTRGILLCSFLLLIVLVSNVSSLMYFFQGAIICYAAAIILFLYILYDSYRVNSKKNGIELKCYNKWYFYLIFSSIFFLVINFFAEKVVMTSSGYKKFRYRTTSNSPLLQPDDIVVSFEYKPDFLTKLANHPHMDYSIFDYRRGSMILYRPPFSTSPKFISRIVALGGDTFWIKNGVSYLNGKILPEPYVLPANKLTSYSREYGPIKVPYNSVLVLNDSRDNSSDSRYFGPIPNDWIEGKILYILWSHNLKRMGLRLDT